MKLQCWVINQAGHLCMRKFWEQSAEERGPGHHAGVVLECFTPERVIIFYLDTLNRVGVFFSDDFRFPLPQKTFGGIFKVIHAPPPPPEKRKKKSWPHCCRDREALSLSVPLQCFQRWQRLREDNTVQHGCPNPDQRGDNQSQSKSYSGKLFFMFACPHPTWGGSCSRLNSRSQTHKHERWTGGEAGRT